MHSNPLLALESAYTTRYDAAFLDIQMPGMTGLELAEQLSVHQKQMEIIFITAYNHYATEAFEVNAIDYILKPIRIKRFEKAMERLFDKRQEEPIESKTLKIKAFGTLKLYYGEKEIRWNRPKTQELFSFLFLNRNQSVHKDTICEALWPQMESQKTLSNLQVTMHRLRKDLACFESEQIQIEYYNHYYTMWMTKGEIDVEQFLEAIQSEDKVLLEQAFSLYTGDLFEKEGALWSLSKRETLRKEYERVLLRLLVCYMEDKNYELVLERVRAYQKIGYPTEAISQLYLEAACLTQSRDMFQESFELLKLWYEKELDLKIPRNLVNQYHKQWKMIGKNW
ncbi:MAG: two-component system, LytTR family, response regulator [Clostridiales bacterium]|nr:two-component system, LytTR family, response regulator [Clostridiales bacterium]